MLYALSIIVSIAAIYSYIHSHYYAINTNPCICHHHHHKSSDCHNLFTTTLWVPTQHAVYMNQVVVVAVTFHTETICRETVSNMYVVVYRESDIVSSDFVCFDCIAFN